MNNGLDKIIAALNTLSMHFKNSIPDDQFATRYWGWNAPPLNKHDMAEMSELLAVRISEISIERLLPSFPADEILNRITEFQNSNLPYISNGNISGSYQTYLALLCWLETKFGALLLPPTDWVKLSSDGLLPKSVERKLNSYKTSIKAFDKDFEGLSDKITYINQAHQAALDLPTDLESLNIKTEEVNDLKKLVEQNYALSKNALDQIKILLETIKEKEKEAIKLVENTEDAYSAATTKGLGEAFQTRADQLTKSMLVWVSGLICALGLGAWAGIERVKSLQLSVATNGNDAQVSLNFFLALISVAAPIWFAWVATKQIGHRFRLSEDYAFKASVAKAYEGYRREAARLDPSFAARLFASALDRIDEAPIRFVENETFGSPWHEFIGSKLKAGTRTPTSASNKKSTAETPPASSN